MIRQTLADPFSFARIYSSSHLAQCPSRRGSNAWDRRRWGEWSRCLCRCLDIATWPEPVGLPEMEKTGEEKVSVNPNIYSYSRSTATCVSSPFDIERRRNTYIFFRRLDISRIIQSFESSLRLWPYGHAIWPTGNEMQSLDVPRGHSWLTVSKVWFFGKGELGNSVHASCKKAIPFLLLSPGHPIYYCRTTTTCDCFSHCLIPDSASWPSFTLPVQNWHCTLGLTFHPFGAPWKVK